MCAFSLSSTWRPIQPRSGSLEARIQAIEADNQRIVGMCAAPKSTMVSAHMSNGYFYRRLLTLCSEYHSLLLLVIVWM